MSHSYSGKTCQLYETPVIFVSYEENQCFEKCNEMSECKTLGKEVHTNSSCYLFNATFDKIPD
ncbi:hypothetical protein LOTGIDRAFT_239429, partial [Lottia gigantea]